MPDIFPYNEPGGLYNANLTAMATLEATAWIFVHKIRRFRAYALVKATISPVAEPSILFNDRPYGEMLFNAGDKYDAPQINLAAWLVVRSTAPAITARIEVAEQHILRLACTALLAVRNQPTSWTINALVQRTSWVTVQATGPVALRQSQALSSRAAILVPRQRDYLVANAAILWHQQLGLQARSVVRRTQQAPLQIAPTMLAQRIGRSLVARGAVRRTFWQTLTAQSLMLRTQSVGLTARGLLWARVLQPLVANGAIQSTLQTSLRAFTEVRTTQSIWVRASALVKATMTLRFSAGRPAGGLSGLAGRSGGTGSQHGAVGAVGAVGSLDGVSGASGVSGVRGRRLVGSLQAGELPAARIRRSLPPEVEGCLLPPAMQDWLRSTSQRFRLYAAFLPPFPPSTQSDSGGFVALTKDPRFGTGNQPGQIPDPTQQDGIWHETIIFRPVVVMGPNRLGFAGQPLVFSAQDSWTRNGGQLTYRWAVYNYDSASFARDQLVAQLDSGPSATLVAWTPPAPGTYYIQCTVIDQSTLDPVTGAPAQSTGTRFIKVYADKQSAYDAVVEVQQLQARDGGWSAVLRATGAPGPVIDGKATSGATTVLPDQITDWTRVLLYTEDFWDQPAAGTLLPPPPANVASDTLDWTVGLDPAHVRVGTDGQVQLLGQHDPHIVFNGLVLASTIRQDAEMHDMLFEVATPEILLRRSQIWNTPFYDNYVNPDLGGPNDQVIIKGKDPNDPSQDLVTIRNKRGYVVDSGPNGERGRLTSRDVLYQLIRGETTWADYYDLLLFPNEPVLINQVSDVTALKGSRWQAMAQILQAELSVLYCTKQGRLIARIHPNIGYVQGDTTPQATPLLVLDRDLIWNLSVSQQPPRRVSLVQVSGITSAQQAVVGYAWQDDQGSWITDRYPESITGEIALTEGLRTDDQQVVAEWAKRMYRWKNATYPQLLLTTGLLHLLEPYDLVAVLYQSEQN